MKVRHLLATAVTLSISTGAFAASNVETLFKEANCNNCHAIESVMVGPTLREVADKYKGDKEAQATLEKKVRDGGPGSWGVMPMPPTPQSVSDESIKTLVSWILEQNTKPK